MRVLPIASRELRSSFNSPIAYIVAAAYLVFTSVWLFFLNQFFSHNEASLRIYFSVVPTVFVFLVPALTMRSWAEERRTGTLEVLLTLPFREGELVLGKFLGAFGLLCIVVALSIPLPLTLAPLGIFDWGQVVGEYLGVLFIGAAGLAVGPVHLRAVDQPDHRVHPHRCRAAGLHPREPGQPDRHAAPLARQGCELGVLRPPL